MTRKGREKVLRRKKDGPGRRRKKKADGQKRREEARVGTCREELPPTWPEFHSWKAAILSESRGSFLFLPSQVLFIVPESVIQDHKVQNRQDISRVKCSPPGALCRVCVERKRYRGILGGICGGGTSWSGDTPVSLGWKGQMKLCLFSVDLGMPSRS